MNRDKLTRRLRYQASRRASLELELMLKRLVSPAALETFSDEDLIGLDELLQLDEMTLQSILLNRGPRPEGTPVSLWEKVLALLVEPETGPLKKE